MIKLAPQKIDFVINATQLNANYDETGAVSIQVEAQRLEHIEKNTYAMATLVFERVAELRCITLMFSSMSIKTTKSWAAKTMK
ncbi:hypothetical protein [Pseudomonas putida]|uniref:hypothetical protein n=1 Tax=Pseudomonas putida TaxID=303 RepID=UPI0009C186B6|nr:hypothetical protein [Pseudomonas putida]